MDFTQPPSSNSNPPIHANPISSIPSSRKLPIKRKNPNSNSTLILTLPDSSPHDVTPPPPFKFHRVWSEPDEIRLLQSLLHSSSLGFSFPKDLGIFYTQFCNGMSQPYSKSQLSEKLRRLRKKFRVITSRLDKGLDKALLSPQDRALYDLSKQLWDPAHHRVPEAHHPDHLDHLDKQDEPDRPPLTDDDPISIPSIINNNDDGDDGCKSSMMAVLALPTVVKNNNHSRDNVADKVDASYTTHGDVGKGVNKMDGNEVEMGGGMKVGNIGDELSNGIVRFAKTTLADLVDEELKKMRMRMMVEFGRFLDVEKEVRFEKRWRDQRVAEFDVLAKRLKLVMESCSMVGK